MARVIGPQARAAGRNNMKLSLRDRLIRYLKHNHGYIASGALQRLAAEKTTYTPRSVVRRLEELTQEGILEVQYRKGHSFYRFNGGQAPGAIVERMAGWFDALPESA